MRTSKFGTLWVRALCLLNPRTIVVVATTPRVAMFPLVLALVWACALMLLRACALAGVCARALEHVRSCCSTALLHSCVHVLLVRLRVPACVLRCLAFHFTAPHCTALH